MHFWKESIPFRYDKSRLYLAESQSFRSKLYINTACAGEIELGIVSINMAKSDCQATRNKIMQSLHAINMNPHRPSRHVPITTTKSNPKRKGNKLFVLEKAVKSDDGSWEISEIY